MRYFTIVYTRISYTTENIVYIYIYRIFSIDHRIYIVIYDIRYTKYDLFVYRIHYSAFFQGLWGQSLPLVFLCTLCVFDTDCTYVLNFEFLTFTEACKFVRQLISSNTQLIPFDQGLALHDKEYCTYTVHTTRMI